MTQPLTTEDSRRAWGRAVGAALAAAAIVGLVLLAFIWPAVTAKPHDVPVAVAGPVEQTNALGETLAANGPLDVTSVADRAAAEDLIRKREVVAAVVLGPQPVVLTASAGGQVPTQIAAQLATGLQAQLSKIAATQGAPAPTIETVDVVPLATADAQGIALNAAAFPLVIGGIIGGAVIAVGVTGTLRRACGVLVYGVAAGLLITLILQPWLNVLHGSFVANATAVAVAVSATASVIVGLRSLIGLAGVGLGAAATLLMGMPISGAMVPTEFLLGSWGSIGQGFVPGSAMTLMRNLSYFPDAATAGRWWTLSISLGCGIALIFAASARRRTPVSSGREEAPTATRDAVLVG